jgi:hypothetical protein
MDYRPCAVCGGRASEMHHVTKRSAAKNLVHCKLIQVPLCPECHRGRNGVHHNRELDLKLKLELQNKLEMLFDKELLTAEEVNDVLELSERCLRGFLKPLPKEKGIYYRRNEIIKACMGGRLYGDS